MTILALTHKDKTRGCAFPPQQPREPPTPGKRSRLLENQRSDPKGAQPGTGGDADRTQRREISPRGTSGLAVAPELGRKQR